LYSAGFAAEATADPHSLQNLAVGDNSVPQAVHVTGVWFHPYRRYAGSLQSHLRKPLDMVY
jgi:hypothetical protein